MKRHADTLTADERKAILQARGIMRHWFAIDDLDRELFANDPDNDFYGAYGLVQKIKELVAPLPSPSTDATDTK
jgi:hypothetical protein